MYHFTHCDFTGLYDDCVRVKLYYANTEHWMGRNIAVACVNADPSGLSEEDYSVYMKINDHVIILSEHTR